MKELMGNQSDQCFRSHSCTPGLNSFIRGHLPKAPMNLACLNVTFVCCSGSQSGIRGPLEVPHPHAQNNLLEMIQFCYSNKKAHIYKWGPFMATNKHTVSITPSCIIFRPIAIS